LLSREENEEGYGALIAWVGYVKRLGFFLVLLLIVIGWWLVDFLMDAGQFKSIQPHFSGTCFEVAGISGPEDITIHPGKRIAYISSTDRWALQQGEPGKGAIFSYDLSKDHPKPVIMQHDFADDFNPHGMSLFVDKQGNERLFVVNHSKGRHSIEIFQLNNDNLAHLETLQDPMMISPNDVVAVGLNQVYFTNDHGYADGALRTLEEYARLKRANLVYYDGRSYKEAASGFSYANGVNVSRDGKKLYLAATTEMTLYVFQRDIESGTLSQEAEIALDTGVDNIEIDANGDVWIGAHPQLLKFVGHAGDSSKLSPSQVLRIRQNSSGDYAVAEKYLDKGQELSGSSVAAVLENRLLIGAVFESRFLDCRMSQHPQ
jgi:arylesterase/paraoxonase